MIHSAATSSGLQLASVSKEIVNMYSLKCFELWQICYLKKTEYKNQINMIDGHVLNTILFNICISA